MHIMHAEKDVHIFRRTEYLSEPAKNWADAFQKLLAFYRESLKDPFLDRFQHDLVGTTYRVEDFRKRDISHDLEVLTATGYLKRFRKNGIDSWIKVREAGPDFDILDEKDTYYETPGEGDFVDAVRKDLVGTVFDPTVFPGDVSFMAAVLEFGGYLRRMNGGKWIKVAELPDDYKYGKEADRYLDSHD